ncbi:MAG TPA: hypothetical protein VN844_12815 [Pyrinomonadaceae bacterium]|nr:hypothetical protein [Pyrinomonadaceae bacterium]
MLPILTLLLALTFSIPGDLETPGAPAPGDVETPGSSVAGDLQTPANAIDPPDNQGGGGGTGLGN